MAVSFRRPVTSYSAVRALATCSKASGSSPVSGRCRPPGRGRRGPRFAPGRRTRDRPRLHVRFDQSRRGSECRRHRRRGDVLADGGQRGSRIESVPTEPQDEGAERTECHRVTDCRSDSAVLRACFALVLDATEPRPSPNAAAPSGSAVGQEALLPTGVWGRPYARLAICGAVCWWPQVLDPAAQRGDGLVADAYSFADSQWGKIASATKSA